MEAKRCEVVDGETDTFHWIKKKKSNHMVMFLILIH